MNAMPPRFAYWTILIDRQPTAFRARDQQELLPTFHQLKRTNKDVVLRWFARGKLWESPDAERAAWRGRNAGDAGIPRDRDKAARGRDWRPGGQHRDPRQHFRDQKKQRNQERRAARHERRERDDRLDRPPKAAHGFRPSGPGAKKPFRPAGAKKPFKKDGRPLKPGDRRFATAKPGDKKPWRNKPPRRRPPSERGAAPVREETPRRADEETAPPRKRESPERPPPPEQIVIKPEPPERG